MPQSAELKLPQPMLVVQQWRRKRLLFDKKQKIPTKSVVCQTIAKENYIEVQYFGQKSQAANAAVFYSLFGSRILKVVPTPISDDCTIIFPR